MGSMRLKDISMTDAARLTDRYTTESQLTSPDVRPLRGRVDSSRVRPQVPSLRSVTSGYGYSPPSGTVALMDVTTYLRSWMSLHVCAHGCRHISALMDVTTYPRSWMSLHVCAHDCPHISALVAITTYPRS